MKRFFILLFSVATVFGISIDQLKGNVVYASNGHMNVGEADGNFTAVFKGNSEHFKAEFAYEMAQITAKIVSAPTTNVENLKVQFAYASALVTAKVMPIIPSDQRKEFAYEMAQITTKIISDPNLDIEEAKAEITYEIAQITTRVLTDADRITTGNSTILKEHNVYSEPKVTGKVNNNIGTDQKGTLLRNNADIESKAAVRVNNTNTDKKTIANPGYIAPETYTGLIDEMTHVGERRNHTDNKVNINGEIRYHYALNNGSGTWDQDSSGIRLYLGFDTDIYRDWRAYGRLEGKRNVVNYDNDFDLARLYVEGKLGVATLQAGSFGYLMAEGNIHDSGFDGIRADFGGPVKYTVSVGETDDTKETAIATVRYEDFDYNLEAGVYHYEMDDGSQDQNTIWTLGGNYNFSNFGVGAMALGASQKDSKGNNNGYVLSFHYGDLKTWRPGTYEVFAKYYNQPQYTHISHGMNGMGGRMEGFRGYGLGMNYTLKENVVAGIEHYDLRDKISSERGKTWWSQISHYF